MAKLISSLLKIFNCGKISPDMFFTRHVSEYNGWQRKGETKESTENLRKRDGKIVTWKLSKPYIKRKKGRMEGEKDWKEGEMKKEKVEIRYLAPCIWLLLSLTTIFLPLCQSFNYGQALSQSLLYFESQRSGRLPYNQRVTWRHHSALTDGLEQGVLAPLLPIASKP